MNFTELVKKRQSDRRYQEGRRVAREDLIRCLEAARCAPSACNSQPWKFAAQAPAIVAVVLEKMNLTARIGSVIKDKEYSLLDVGIAVEHFCLQAAELGLGTCILGWFDEKKVARLLGVKNRRIPLLITVGYAAGETREKQRKALEEISSWNHY